MSTYADDFVAWAQRQVQALRAGRLDALDVEHLAEEIESMGERDRREVRSRLRVLLAHLLKWQYQPGYRGPSWIATIDEQRNELADVLARSPSLWHVVRDDFGRCYEQGRRTALKETGLPSTSVPQACPYSVEQVLDPEYLPG